MQSGLSDRRPRELPEFQRMPQQLPPAFGFSIWPTKDYLGTFYPFHLEHQGRKVDHHKSERWIVPSRKLCAGLCLIMALFRGPERQDSPSRMPTLVVAGDSGGVRAARMPEESKSRTTTGRSIQAGTPEIGQAPNLKKENEKNIAAL